jgi:hypothetical protein
MPVMLDSHLRICEHINTRITDGLVVYGSAFSLSIGILVEDNVAFILNKLSRINQHLSGLERQTYLALANRLHNFGPATRGSLEANTGACQALTQGISSLPRVVVRDLGANVMQNVGLGNAVSQETAKPSEEGTSASQQLTVKS